MGAAEYPGIRRERRHDPFDELLVRELLGVLVRDVGVFTTREPNAQDDR